MLQTHAVVDHIEKKFSSLHARIMRLLFDRVCFDEKTVRVRLPPCLPWAALTMAVQIGDMIMTPGPMTRSMLYQLRQEQFLRVEVWFVHACCHACTCESANGCRAVPRRSSLPNLI